MAGGFLDRAWAKTSNLALKNRSGGSPSVASDVVIEEDAELGVVGHLWLELHSCDFLEGVFVCRPFDTDVLDGLVLQVLEELDLDRVDSLVVLVEVGKSGRKDICWIVWLDGPVLELPLFLADRDYSHLHDVVAVSVSRLRVLDPVTKISLAFASSNLARTLQPLDTYQSSSYARKKNRTVLLRESTASASHFGIWAGLQLFDELVAVVPVSL